MTDTTIAIAPAISAISAQYSSVVLEMVLTGSPRKGLTRALVLSPRDGNVHSEFEIRRFLSFPILIETRQSPDRLAATLAALPSMSLVPFAPFFSFLWLPYDRNQLG
jgi:hypothetical protein